MQIQLSQILPISNPEQYKLHLACQSQGTRPLDVFVQDRKQWDKWNEWRLTHDDFNRRYIFSLIEFYPQNDRWLFGGAYEVISRLPAKNARGYDVQPLSQHENFVGRLKLELKRPGRRRAFRLERYYQSLIVSEVMAEIYSGEPFPGYENIDVEFSMLKNITEKQRHDWKVALLNVKGVYLITDTLHGKRYVGSAYGETGIWSRWKCYIDTGHGNNVGLRELIDQQEFQHVRQHFRFALLDMFPMKTDDRFVRDRETYWKKVLLTRGDYGYNKN